MAALSWSARRQLLYYMVAGVVGIIVLAVGWKIFFTHTPTCSDGTQNGTELGVDCGGSCALLCTEQTRAPLVRWARAFKTDIGLYTAAAYIENPNSGAGAHSVHYSFQLFDDKNVFVAERDGVIDISPMAVIPIVEHNINVGNRTVARTLFSFAENPTWRTVFEKFPELRLSGQQLESDGSRLSATISNNSLEDAGKVTVIAVLFDVEGVARAASKTTLSSVLRKSSQSIIFTWPTGVPNVVRAETTIVPAF